jgi:hypoxanthine-DNA glycosylase
MIKSSFPPVVDAGVRVLMLGSLPGEASLARAQYYAHSRNQFWRLMEAVTGADLVVAPYEARLARLLAAGVGLWDVIRSARRSGSLDAAIREHSPNALAALAATLPSLRAIAFNGGTASAIGRKQLGAEPGPALLTLPSSSPAHAVPYERKLAEWARLRPFLSAGASETSGRTPR